MSNLVNNISHFLAVDTDYEELSVGIKASYLESTLTEVCFRLAEAEALTGNNKIDIGYLLSIVSSYLMGIQDGSLDQDLTEPPSILFKESLYPSLANRATIETEVIEDDDNIDSGDIEEDASDSVPDLRA